MNFFDNCADAVVNVTSAVFGYTATWGSYTAQVKYKDMAGVAGLGDQKYALDKWTIEIRNSDFPGLRDSINRQNKELITVNVRGMDMYFYGTVANAISDGMCTEIRMRMKV